MEIFKLLGKVKSKYRPVATISQIDAARSGHTCWGVPSPNPAHFALCAFFGCAASYIAPHFRWELVKQQGGTMTKTNTRSTSHNPQHSGSPRKRSSSSSESPQKKSGTWKSCVRFFTSTCPPCFAAAYAPNPSSKPLLSPAAEKMH